MSKIKKMLAVCSAMAMLCGAMTTMSAGAVFNCDVDGDGEVSIVDAMVINRYRLGDCFVDDPSIMDVDGNLVITSGDAQCVIAATIGMQYGVIFD